MNKFQKYRAKCAELLDAYGNLQQEARNAICKLLKSTPAKRIDMTRSPGFCSYPQGVETVNSYIYGVMLGEGGDILLVTNTLDFHPDWKESVSLYKDGLNIDIILLYYIILENI